MNLAAQPREDRRDEPGGSPASFDIPTGAPMSSPDEPDPLAPVLRELRSGSSGQRLDAVHVLASLGSAAESAVPALIVALRDRDIAVRTAVARALAAVGAPAVLPLIEAMQEEDLDLRQAIIITFALLGPAAAPAKPVLQAALEDEHLGPAAEKALRQIERTPTALAFARIDALMPVVLLIAGIFLVLAIGAAGLSWIGTELFPKSSGTAATTAFAVGVLGAVLGGLIGAHRYGPLGAAGGVILLGLGGGLTGLILGGILGGTLEPINQVLRRR